MSKKIILIFVSLCVVGTVLWLILRKPSSKKFKNRINDPFDDCWDEAFEQFPFSWEDNERQEYMSDCLSGKKMKVESKGWVDDYETCKDKKCGNPEKCHNNCDMSNIPPKRPERSQFESGKEYSASIGLYQNAYDIYLEKWKKCHMNCDTSDLGQCRKECCYEAKICDAMNNEPGGQDRVRCIESCDMLSKQGV